ncbi:DUF6931 family protein [Aquabacterium sp.]|uniref:DUF6931 family protein n=1 Tax=Aquabacterium sp. TaxID=1872578 RepID=UPI002BDB7E8D|nr:hypothetical protein [Aquabacterium sp.]HSW03532.1 hypothetical protein [Aquabacterium sp.]
MSATLPKLAAPLAPLLPRLELEPEAASALAGAQTAAEGVMQLEAKGLRNDAVRLAAHALPKREAVWWACMCAGAVPDVALPPADAAARVAAEAWVRKPADDALRRAAWDAAQKTGFRSPEAWAAVGAFWSGGSMAPEGQPVVPPAEHLTGVAVSGAVVMASVRGHPERAQARLERFLSAARDIANGGAGRIPLEEN